MQASGIFLILALPSGGEKVLVLTPRHGFLGSMKRIQIAGNQAIEATADTIDFAGAIDLGEGRGLVGDRVVRFQHALQVEGVVFCILHINRFTGQNRAAEPAISIRTVLITRRRTLLHPLGQIREEKFEQGKGALRLNFKDTHARPAGVY